MTSRDTAEPFEIYKQNGSKRWYVRFSFKAQSQQRIALGTVDEAEARQLARALYYENTALAKARLSVTRKMLAAIAEEFAQSIEQNVERGEKDAYHARQYAPIIRKYFTGYFGEEQLTNPA